MKRTSAAIIVLLAFLPGTIAAQDRLPTAIDLGSEVSGYQRFLLYPHLQKGFELLESGDRTRALVEFERARELAPKNAATALYLANAYRQANDTPRAERVLREQLSHTPGEARITAALSEISSRRPPAAAVARPAVTVPPTSTPPTSTVTERVATPPPSRSTTRTAVRAKAAPAIIAPPTVANGDELRRDFKSALDQHRFDAAAHAGYALVARESNSLAIVDEVTYQLAQAGANDSAMQLLLRNYPFPNGPEDARRLLLDRLTLLVHAHGGKASVDLSALREPLETPVLRSSQGALWAGLKDCTAVRGVLGDMSPDYGYADMMRLGDCSVDLNPAEAKRAYARAHAIAPGGAASLALGYQAYVARDFRTSLDAWLSVSRDQLSNVHRMAAATTAVEAGEITLAEQWLLDYRSGGGALDHRFWSLYAVTQESAGNISAAIDALEHASTLQPEVAAYVNLARLSREPAAQVRWLERATAVDPAHLDAHLELAYAYQRAGRGLDALHALESAAMTAPNDMRVQLELSYAYSQQGLAAKAEAPLVRVFDADRSNLAAARQLVYVSQRLAHNQQARLAAERVIDSLPASEDGESVSGQQVANERFGMQRLHEDLGRRITFGVDGFTGTRVGASSAGGDAGSPYRSYSQMEFDYRLGRAAIRNGRTVSAYVRLLADGGDARQAAPTENPRLGVGVRFKPFGSQVLYLAAEQQRSLDGNPRQEVLLRTSASFLSGQRHGDDWQPSGSRWIAYNLYLDAAHYVKSAQTAAAADFRTSLHLKLASRQTFEPYGHVQLSGTRLTQTESDLRVGIGSRWNLWHGRSRYDADPGKLSLGVEFQRALDTYLPDRSGVFLTLGSRW